MALPGGQARRDMIEPPRRQEEDRVMATRDLTRSSGPRGVLPLSEAMNQVFRDAFTSPFGGGAPGLTMSQGVNLYEQDNRFIVQIPLPGVKPDQLTVTARENVVTLQGTI